MEMMLSFVSSFAMNNPKMAGFCAIAYMIGLAAKTVRETVEKYVKESPSQEDDKKLAEMMEKPFFKYAWMMADFFFRMKK